MPTLPLTSIDNEPVGEVTLSERVFGVRPNDHLLWEAARQARAGRRAGTHKTKGRGEVSGAGRKLWRQKGTGRARIGSIRSPIWRHGGTVFGPVPRDYSYRLPRKAWMGALRSALSKKVVEGGVVVVSELPLPAARTQELDRLMRRLGVTGKGLFVTAEKDEALLLAARNLSRATVKSARTLTPYDVLQHGKLVMTEDAVKRIEEAYGR